MAHRAPKSALAPLIVGSALLMQSMDSTMSAAAIPAMAAHFGVASIDLHLILSGYLVGSAAFLPVCGWIAERVGARVAFVSALLIFGVLSLACGFCETLPQLVAARVALGATAGLLLPVGRLLLLKSTPPERLLNTLAMYTIPMLTGPMIGPVIGGVLVDVANWRWVYFINAPLALASAWLIYVMIDPLPRQRVAALDWLGWGMSGLALCAAGAVLASIGRAPAMIVLLLAAAAALGGLAFLWHARRTPAPALDISLFRLPVFHLAVLASSFVRMPLSAGPFLLSLLLQVAFGLSPASTGGLIMLNAMGALLMRATAAPISNAAGLLRTTWASALVSSISIGACAVFVPQTPVWVLGGVLFVQGFARSLALTNLTAMSFAEVPAERMADATSLFSVAQLMSHAFAVGACAIAVDLAKQAFGDAALQARDVAPAFLLLAILGLASLPAIRGLPARLNAQFNSA